MKVALLLALFEPFFDGAYIDTEKPGLQDIMRDLTADQQAYVSVAEEAFAEYLLNADDPSYLSLEKTVSVLRALLFLDGRSELALLRVAELAYQNPRHALEATNALAGLALYYRSGGEASVPPEELIQRFETYMKNPDLFHNARECRNALRAR